MPLPKLPVTGLDDLNHRRRVRETINGVLDHSYDDWRKQTAYEKEGGVTPVNPAYPPGHIMRYAARVDGSSDDRPSIDAAYVQWKLGGSPIFCPPGISYVSRSGANDYALLFDSHVCLIGDGGFTLKADDDDYNIIRIDGGTEVDVFIKGINYDHSTASVAADASDHICLRIQSSINTIRVEDMAATGHLGDAIYFNADVPGIGGHFRNVNTSTGGAGRSLITVAKGEKIRVVDSTAVGIGLQGFVVAPPNNTTVVRNIDFINCAVYGGGNYGGSYATTDRAGFYIGGVSGASATVQCKLRSIGCRVHDFGNSAAGTVPLVLGIETREIKSPIVTGFIATGITRSSNDTGLYSYLTTGAVYQGCVSINNDKGIWMNACGEYTEEGNTCINNTTKNRDYNGPDGATNFIKAAGMVEVLARGSVSFSAGSPVINSKYNISGATDLATGDTKFTFSNAVANANYSVVAMYRSHSGTSGFIQSASHNTTDFRILTYSGTSLSDQPFDFVVLGVPASTTEP